MIVVNTTGRACPESVAMTRAALDKGAEELEVLVDNPEAATNVKRLLEGRGFRVSVCIPDRSCPGKFLRP